jgi:hypothetical protein
MHERIERGYRFVAIARKRLSFSLSVPCGHVERNAYEPNGHTIWSVACAPPGRDPALLAVGPRDAVLLAKRAPTIAGGTNRVVHAKSVVWMYEGREELVRDVNVWRKSEELLAPRVPLQP